MTLFQCKGKLGKTQKTSFIEHQSIMKKALKEVEFVLSHYNAFINRDTLLYKYSTALLNVG